ncbi:MAG: hypothetical protein U9Q33_11110 [Campylobacterota bacterium]|nr:hypothetical protein [Campylobacterota bacterium]
MKRFIIFLSFILTFVSTIYAEQSIEKIDLYIDGNKSIERKLTPEDRKMLLEDISALDIKVIHSVKSDIVVYPPDSNSSYSFGFLEFFLGERVDKKYNIFQKEIYFNPENKVSKENRAVLNYYKYDIPLKDKIPFTKLSLYTEGKNNKIFTIKVDTKKNFFKTHNHCVVFINDIAKKYKKEHKVLELKYPIRNFKLDEITIINKDNHEQEIKLMCKTTMIQLGFRDVKYEEFDFPKLSIDFYDHKIKKNNELRTQKEFKEKKEKRKSKQNGSIDIESMFK